MSNEIKYTIGGINMDGSNVLDSVGTNNLVTIYNLEDYNIKDAISTWATEAEDNLNSKSEDFRTGSTICTLGLLDENDKICEVMLYDNKRTTVNEIFEIFGKKIKKLEERKRIKSMQLFEDK